MIEKQLKKAAEKKASYEPVILNPRKAGDRLQIKKLLSSRAVQHVVDDYHEQLHELYAIKNPTVVYTPEFENKYTAYRTALEKQTPLFEHGHWVFYPWRSALVHVLPEDDFQLVRTARNRNLINAEEQKKFYDAVVGIGGLSVGNSIALAIVLQGGAKHIRLADNDRLALTNTNRVRTGVHSLGVEKVIVTAREIYEINPYAKVDIVRDGITEKNLKRFFGGPPKLDVVIDEMDSLAIKVLLREEAKRRRLPLVTAADNGDNGVLEVERYDLNPHTPFFHDRMGKVSYKSLKNINKFQIGKLITKWVGAETVTDRMKGSLMEMGKTIVSWPQLGGAALLNGSAVAYCVRKIVNGQPLIRGRALLSLDELLTPDYNSARERKHRKESGKKFGKLFGL